MTNIDESQQTLPGLELHAPGAIGAPSAMRVAVGETIAALQAENLIQPRHVALCQLALELADAVTAGGRGGRASAAAMAAAQLRETLLALPAPEEAEAGQAFQQWVTDMIHRGESEQ